MFDISQTDPIPGATPIPQNPAQQLTGADDHGILEPLTAYLHSGGWNILREPLTRANGYTDPDRHEVVIGRDLTPEHATKTLIHEAAHITLQHIDDVNEYRQHRGRMEVEAESVAYIVAGLNGFDTSAYSIGYITGWANEDLDLIRETAARVLRCAHTLATQTLRVDRPLTMLVRLVGDPHPDATAKDLALAVIRTIGHDGGTGHLIEFQGEAVRSLSMEGRMTLCNMAIEAGARSGLIAPDQTTFDYLQGRDRSPIGPLWNLAVAAWATLRSDEGAEFDKEVEVDVTGVGPMVTWGTNPGQAVPVGAGIPTSFASAADREAAETALTYMGLRPGQSTTDIPVHTVFIGSCTNGRTEDLRAAAKILVGRRIAPGIRAIVVPGSAQVKAHAENEGLDRIFVDAGFEWRGPGCSMCVGMNGDTVPEGKHAVSTSNRNFEGRQGQGSRTHLVSPETAAATAVAGKLSTPSQLGSP